MSSPHRSNTNRSSPPPSGTTVPGSDQISSPVAYPTSSSSPAPPSSSAFQHGPQPVRRIPPPPQFRADPGSVSSPLAYTSSSPRHGDPRTPRGTPRNAPPGSLSSALLSDVGTPGRAPGSSVHTPRSSGSSGPQLPRSELGQLSAPRGDLHGGGPSPAHSRLFVDSSLGSDRPESVSGASAGTLSYASDAPSELPSDEPVRVIWGTNVSIQECADVFRNFLLSFKYKYRAALDKEYVLPGEGDSVAYVPVLRRLVQLGTTNLNLDTRNMLAYPPTKKLYYQLQNYPQEVIPVMDQTVKDTIVALIMSGELDGDLDAVERTFYKVRPYNLDSRRGMRELNPGDIDKLVVVKGLTLRTTPIIPDMKVAFFKCSVCDHTTNVQIDRGVIAEPVKCPRVECGQANTMQIVHNRSTFADKQVIKIQETPDSVPDGQTPHSVSLCVYDELADSCRAGDRIEVTGIFRSTPVRVNPVQRTMKRLYKTYIDVVHIQKVDRRRLGVDVTTLDVEPPAAGGPEAGLAAAAADEVEELRKITEEDVQRIRDVAQRPDLYELLARSLAPSVYEMDDVKKGILLQLFGGTVKKFTKGGAPRYRGEINVLLCGDPSTSKSQILQYVHKIAPRGIYTSGKGSSAVGLTAYVTRDVDTKQFVLESGALVLSDGGICCIDEFDKMSESTRSVLHEVMEQQTVSIAKAGIIATLNARTSILASANPIGSKYNPDMPVTQNIDLPPTLLSRFDLVYLLLDKVDESTDRMLAKHLTAMYLEDAPQTVSRTEVLPVEFLTMYISYAKQYFHPIITPEAKDELVKAYVDMRKMGEDVRAAERRITATTRQLESMIRLSEAHAKMRLSEQVTVEDVREAVRLIKSAIKDYATDPLTGRIDMDLVQTGTSSAVRQLKLDLQKELLNTVEELTNAKVAKGGNGVVSYTELLRAVNEKASGRIENVELSEALRRLEQEGLVVIQGEGHRRSIRKADF